ncbi:LytTR family transcriptional regulator [Amylibacter marinus]|uniref:LytTR family transcriptional regulator n=1 Tax=Amylibacter marinus TaxID=1475483 RepID=A0ABQ5VVE6_9RHOB|nr:DUF4159 domain-containing protein [Amylibacter marinus]GLQ35223.1 LytTR family transcriptional regulator [Amylibacter marinus]
MFGIANIGFLNPLLLWALAVLPVLYWLLRATPPAPIVRKFPAVVLLLGLLDKENTPDRTPWWLLLIRLVAVAAVILAFAGPVLNPQARSQGDGPMVIAMDATWASAQDWQARLNMAEDLVRQAQQDDRPVALIKLTDTPTEKLLFQSGADLTQSLHNLLPNAWAPDYQSWATALREVDIQQLFWISDGLAHADRALFQEGLDTEITVIQGNQPVLGLGPLAFVDGTMEAVVYRPFEADPFQASIDLLGPDPTGITRVLASQDVEILEAQTDVNFELPTELRNRVSHARLRGVRSAGAVVLTDETLRSRKVALLAGQQSQEAGDLLASLHYVRKALENSATLIETDLRNALLATPDILIFADIGRLSEAETEAVSSWVKEGGLLVRFAGPRLISSGLGQRKNDPLLPVRLRAGGRDVGGAMSWGAPKQLREFADGTPFYGLEIPEEVLVKAQVIAQPDPDLSDKVLASLQDGTPLITASDLGDGRVILFHVTANAEWSSLPLSGLFVKMLERLSVVTRRSNNTSEQLQGVVWKPLRVLDGFGEITDADNIAGVEGALLASAPLSATQPPGIYGVKDRRVALNVIDADTPPQAMSWKSGTRISPLERSNERELKSIILIAALLLLVADILGTMLASGRGLAKAAVVLMLGAGMIDPAQAQDDDAASILAANNTVLAYVITGDARVDETSMAGLRGLSAELTRRTAIEPIPPVGVDLDQDDLSLFPFLYWPMSEGHALLSDDAVSKVNQFLRSGGMILFDTRDAQIASLSGGGTKLGRRLQQIAQRLDIPPLEVIADDHVLTRSFYLMQSFPGRYANAPLWVEATSDAQQKTEGMPFRNLNDGVTPVLIGGNDWAAAWAIDERGRYMFPVGRGANGDLQREYAQRFGVNLLMYAMTGNYKSDQVHIPALLNRLGQ